MRRHKNLYLSHDLKKRIFLTFKSIFILFAVCRKKRHFICNFLLQFSFKAFYEGFLNDIFNVIWLNDATNRSYQLSAVIEKGTDYSGIILHLHNLYWYHWQTQVMSKKWIKPFSNKTYDSIYINIGILNIQLIISQLNMF